MQYQSSDIYDAMNTHRQPSTVGLRCINLMALNSWASPQFHLISTIIRIKVANDTLQYT